MKKVFNSLKEIDRLFWWLIDDCTENGCYRRALTKAQGRIRAVIYGLFQISQALLLLAMLYIFYIFMALLPI